MGWRKNEWHLERKKIKQTFWGWKKITEHYKHSGDEKKLLKDINEIKDLHRDKWRHLERKKTQTKGSGEDTFLG